MANFITIERLRNRTREDLPIFSAMADREQTQKNKGGGDDDGGESGDGGPLRGVA